MSSVGNLTLTKQIAHEMAILLLESPAQDKIYGTPKSLDYMEIYLCGKHNLQACFHYLKGKAQALARLGPEFVRVGSLGAKELLALLCNSEPNARQG